jgi:hypothetical protein
VEPTVVIFTLKHQTLLGPEFGGVAVLLKVGTYFTKFYVHGSVHLGNVYVQLKVQLDVHVFICIIYSSIFFLYKFRVLFAPIIRSTNCRVQPYVCVMILVC